MGTGRRPCCGTTPRRYYNPRRGLTDLVLAAPEGDPRHRAGPGRARRPAPDVREGAETPGPGRGGHHRRTAPKLVLTFFFRQSRRGRYIIKPLVPGMVGMFAGTVSRLPHPGCSSSTRSTRCCPARPPNADPHAGAGGRVRRRDDPGLPGQRQGQLVDDRPGRSKTVLDPAGRGGGPAAGRAQGAARAGRPGPRRSRAHPPARSTRADLKTGPGTAQGGTRPFPAAGPRLAQRRLAAAAMPAQPAPPHRRRHRRRVRRAALPFTLTAGQGRGGRERSPGELGLRLPDAPAAAGGRSARARRWIAIPGHAPGGGTAGRPGGPARPDRSIGPAALPGPSPACSARWPRPVNWGAARARHRRGPCSPGRFGAAAPAVGAVRRVSPGTPAS